MDPRVAQEQVGTQLAEARCGGMLLPAGVRQVESLNILPGGSVLSGPLPFFPQELLPGRHRTGPFTALRRLGEEGRKERPITDAGGLHLPPRRGLPSHADGLFASPGLL